MFTGACSFPIEFGFFPKFIISVRGFRNIGVLAEDYDVYAIDLIGFGASEKPQGFEYTMETWAQVK